MCAPRVFNSGNIIQETAYSIARIENAFPSSLWSVRCNSLLASGFFWVQFLAAGEQVKGKVIDAGDLREDLLFHLRI